MMLDGTAQELVRYRRLFSVIFAGWICAGYSDGVDERSALLESALDVEGDAEHAVRPTAGYCMTIKTDRVETNRTFI